MSSTANNQTAHTKPPLPRSASPSCAACKHQRKRCPPDCPLVPYFPANKQREFINVHRLFGVSYVTKLLENVAPQKRDDAAQSIIYEANARAADPVGGCVAIIWHLQAQIDHCSAELQVVLENLAFQRERFMHNLDHFDYSSKP